MSLSSTALADALKNEIGNESTEPPAVTALAAAFITYFEDAQAGVIDIDIQPGAQAIVEGALTGISTPGQGATKIQAAFVAFWVDVIAQTSLYFPGTISPATPPAGLTGIAAALDPVFTANTSGALSADDALDAVATAIHPLNAGGTTTLPGAPPTTVVIT